MLISKYRTFTRNTGNPHIRGTDGFVLCSRHKDVLGAIIRSKRFTLAAAVIYRAHLCAECIRGAVSASA